MRRVLGSLILGLALLAAAPGSALAGRVLVTGHDADLHCGGTGEQCHFLTVAINYVRGGAPDKNKPVLVLDKGDLDLEKSLDKAFTAGSVPRKVMDPVSPEFAGEPLTTSRYSAILVASDSSCGGCDLNSGSTADSDAINKRKNDIANFFNEGGGVLALAGADHGGNDTDTTDDIYYSFIPVPVGGVAVTRPFTLTTEGRALGLEDKTNGIGTNDDINCCATHNSFELPPAGGPLKVAETDANGKAETLFGEGSISGDKIVDKPPTGPTGPIKPSEAIKFPPNKKCVSRRKFRIRLRSPRRIKIEQAIVFVNGKRVKVVKGRRVTAPVDLRGLPRGRFTVKITVILVTGKVIVGSRKYRTCAGKSRPRRPPPV